MSNTKIETLLDEIYFLSEDLTDSTWQEHRRICADKRSERDEITARFFLDIGPANAFNVAFTLIDFAISELMANDRARVRYDNYLKRLKKLLHRDPGKLVHITPENCRKPGGRALSEAIIDASLAISWVKVPVAMARLTHSTLKGSEWAGELSNNDPGGVLQHVIVSVCYFRLATHNLPRFNSDRIQTAEYATIERQLWKKFVRESGINDVYSAKQLQ